MSFLMTIITCKGCAINLSELIASQRDDFHRKGYSLDQSETRGYLSLFTLERYESNSKFNTALILSVDEEKKEIRIQTPIATLFFQLLARERIEFSDETKGFPTMEEMKAEIKMAA